MYRTIVDIVFNNGYSVRISQKMYENESSEGAGIAMMWCWDENGVQVFYDYFEEEYSIDEPVERVANLSKEYEGIHKVHWKDYQYWDSRLDEISSTEPLTALLHD